MSKVILVMEDPISCSNCMVAQRRWNSTKQEEYWVCGKARKDDELGFDVFTKISMDWEKRPDCCPLKSAPDKKHQPQYEGNGVFGYKTAMRHEYARGWNECIDYFTSKEV